MSKDKYFNIRLTTAERQKLQRTARRAGLSMSDYVRSIINADDGSGTVQLVQVNVDEKRLADLLHELKKSGTNLNQIAYKLNARGDIDLGEFGEAVRRHTQAASDVSDFIEELRPRRAPDLGAAVQPPEEGRGAASPQAPKKLNIKIGRAER